MAKTALGLLPGELQAYRPLREPDNRQLQERLAKAWGSASATNSVIWTAWSNAPRRDGTGRSGQGMTSTSMVWP